jgi:hypothetical protein
MRERTLARAAIAGFAVGVIGLALVARCSGDDSAVRLPALALGDATGAQDKAAPLSLPEGVIEYRVKGTLPELPTRGRAWTLGRDGDSARIETLARALGLSGPVEALADGWTVSADGHSLRVERQAGLPWYFGPDAGGRDGGCVVAPVKPGAPPPTLDTPVSSDGCILHGGGAGGSAGSISSGGSIGSTGSIGWAGTDAVTATTTVVCPPPCPSGAVCPTIECAVPEPVAEPQRPADLPTREQAEATARALLAKAGVELDGARVRVEDGFSQWRVDVDPQVGGLPTVGLTSGVSVGPKGAIEGANGWLAQPGEGDEYPLVTAAVGLDRLKQPPFGIGPRPLTAQASACEACATQPPVVQTITGVRVGLAFAPLLDSDDAGRALLVPVFLFDIEEGGTVPVLAVADEFLPKPVPDEKPEPVPEPGPATTEPATEPGRATTQPASEPPTETATSSTSSTTSPLP